MPESTATILIPDISGYTRFITSTELGHSSHAINYLIEAIINAVENDYEVAEIEGDAVLLIRRGPAPSRDQILDTCLKIFNAFHFQRKWMQQHTICPCGACQAIIDLKLKFVAHHGLLGEVKVGRFVKPSGTEMIVAHRLLKNNISDKEYILITEKLLNQAPASKEGSGLEWIRASEAYESIGEIPFEFALLDKVRGDIPDPPPPDKTYVTDNSSFLEVPVAAGFMDVYMAMMNIPGRQTWMPGLQKVEQEIPDTFIGSVHYCTFENYQVVLSPLRMELTLEGILYAESCRIDDISLSLVHEYVYRKVTDNSSVFAVRYLNAGDTPVPEEMRTVLFDRLQRMAKGLKEFCEKGKANEILHS